MVLSQASHCALIVLSELAYNCDKKGILLSEISERNNVPEDILTPIVERLSEVGVIYHKESDGKRWMLLKNHPSLLSVYDVVMCFDGENFSGRFIDINTGKILPKSKLSHIISLERDHMIRYMNNRFRKFKLVEWVEIAQRRYQPY